MEKIWMVNVHEKILKKQFGPLLEQLDNTHTIQPCHSCVLTKAALLTYNSQKLGTIQASVKRGINKLMMYPYK